LQVNYKHSEITDKIIEAFYKVYNTLGYGFLEKVYERAMMIELTRLGLECSNQNAVKVYFDNQIVGDYVSDNLVEQKVITELKTAERLILADEAQLINYLKATTIEVGLLVNFRPKPEVRRKVFSNEFKNNIPNQYKSI
jgi:GxxExxY protein